MLEDFNVLFNVIDGLRTRGMTREDASNLIICIGLAIVLFGFSMKTA